MKKLVLVGAGHAHALLLLSTIKQPLVSAKVVVVSPISGAPYSGMIPGWLAGQYAFEDTLIDFEGLCQRAGAKWIPAELTSLDPDAKTMRLSDGQRLNYDWLSLNVGFTLYPPELPAAREATQATGATESLKPQILAMRPLWTLKERYEEVLDVWRADSGNGPLTVTAVGAGAAGVESLLCILSRLRELRSDRDVRGYLVNRTRKILPSFSAIARYQALRKLRAANVTLVLGTEWRDSIATSSDLLIWATGAQAHPWQMDATSRGSLGVTSDGYIEVDETLISRTHSTIFAVGDCAQLPEPLPKAGVFAVRMANTLENNLRLVLAGEEPEKFKVNSTALALLNTADGSAIASRGLWGLQGRWVWRWKDAIDRRFINRFR